MRTRLVKLSFAAPVHFGAGRLSDGECACSADTLFSALFIEALGQDASEDLLRAVRSGGFLISDAFPWIGDTHYLPKPFAAPASMGGERVEGVDSAAKKAFKKLRYVPWDSYGSYFDGSLDAVEALRALREGLGAGGVVSKVNLQREDRDEAEPYHVGGFRFGEDAGLYFLAQGDYGFEPLLETLSCSGLGGKRSSGYGRFEYEVRDCDGFISCEGIPTGMRVLLSSAAPTADELSDELLRGASCSLVKRSGFVQSQNYAPMPLKKRDFFVFDAGSTFEMAFSGDVFDVSVGGAHPVWRYAKAMWMEG
ncbi:type III-A CRISPR-associated RAMP protein Csm4 [Gordonibacter sp. An230]|uniref:type III-A CRISPR-associated RAMP protein Csm4 n=1 Tax=Gordonibacter sp. An230 TaxID=1965592 RepID=UPI000B3A3330|nr:type III-A CRISPR-associated RAMP protein Csm4 [Gordonibacter sp. An230]OUO91763.1 type III-A CRISPR-associated RAMP protein Csm4 [Gordonibacter sp. An230]